MKVKRLNLLALQSHISNANFSWTAHKIVLDENMMFCIHESWSVGLLWVLWAAGPGVIWWGIILITHWIWVCFRTKNVNSERSLLGIHCLFRWEKCTSNEENSNLPILGWCVPELFLTLSPAKFWHGLGRHWMLTHPLLQIEVSVKINNRMANNVDPDETARYELSHLDLHCLQRYLYWSVLCRNERVNDLCC